MNPNHFFLISTLLILLELFECKQYTPCWLARYFWDTGLAGTRVEIARWVCIASLVDYNTKNQVDDTYGIFQISSSYWCGKGKPCNISCDLLLDDDIKDDFECAVQIRSEHGFEAWTAQEFCEGNVTQFLTNCFKGGDQTTQANADDELLTDLTTESAMIVDRENEVKRSKQFKNHLNTKWRQKLQKIYKTPVKPQKT